MAKIIESKNLDDYQIWTDSGWQDISAIHKTIKYQVWIIKTENFYLECADTHIIFDKNYNEIFIEDLIVGDKIWTENGLEAVLSIVVTDRIENMFDVTVNSLDHRLYTNGILSHNTTVLTILALHEACFNDFKNIFIIANKEDTAKMIFKRVKMAYEALPVWLKPAVKTWGQTSLELANGSFIGISTTTGSAGRGHTINLLLLDELSWIEPDSIVEDFWNSVMPAISKAETSKVLVTSTPRGKSNLFYRVYSAALKEGEVEWNGFHPERVDWNELPGRDEEWKKKQISIMGSYEAFSQEYGNEFLDTGESAIDTELFEELKKNCREPKIILDDGHYKIWEEPDSSRVYVAGVDVSEGVNQDASVIQILDITDLKEIIQVAEYHNNTIAPAEFSNKLYEILQNWGNPLVLIERNNQGGQVCDRLAIDFGYEKVVSWGAKKSHRMNEQHGIISHTNTKHSAILNERYFINEVRVVKFNSIATLNEFKSFIRYPNGTWKAKGGEHDDRVMALVWALMILYTEITQLYFEIKDTDDFGKPMVLEQMEWGTKPFENPTSIYTNEQVERIENSFLCPVSFGAFGEGDDEMGVLLADGWKFVGGQAPYIRPDRQMTRESHEIMEKYFN